MGQLASDAVRKLLAVGVLVLAAYLLFELLVGFLTGLAWVAVAVLALIAVVWAIRVL